MINVSKIGEFIKNSFDLLSIKILLTYKFQILFNDKKIDNLNSMHLFNHENRCSKGWKGTSPKKIKFFGKNVTKY